MSSAVACELSDAVHDRLKRCSTSEAMCVLARFVGRSLVHVPAGNRALALALFVELAQQEITEQLIGHPAGRA